MITGSLKLAIFTLVVILLASSPIFARRRRKSNSGSDSSGSISKWSGSDSRSSGSDSRPPRPRERCDKAPNQLSGSFKVFGTELIGDAPSFFQGHGNFSVDFEKELIFFEQTVVFANLVESTLQIFQRLATGEVFVIGILPGGLCLTISLSDFGAPFLTQEIPEDAEFLGESRWGLSDSVDVDSYNLVNNEDILNRIDVTSNECALLRSETIEFPNVTGMTNGLLDRTDFYDLKARVDPAVFDLPDTCFLLPQIVTPAEMDENHWLDMMMESGRRRKRSY